MSVRAFFVQTFGLIAGRRGRPARLLQFPWSLDTGVECLPVRRVAVMACRFQQVASLLGQRDDSGIAVQSNGVDEPRFPESQSSPFLESKGCSNLSRRSLAGTTRKAPTVVSVRASELRNV
jgi:hypothetical protein